MEYTLLHPPVGYPVTLDQVKLEPLRIDFDTLDDSITGWLAGATDEAQRRTGLLFLTQRWQLELDGFPVGNKKQGIGKPPLQSVQSVSYLDMDGVRQTLPDTEYQVMPSLSNGFVLPSYGKTWPAHRRFPGSVRIEFTCGYGDADNVPDVAKSWIRLQVGAQFSGEPLTAAVDAMLNGIAVFGC